MHHFDDVYEKVKASLIESCGLSEKMIEPDKSLMDDLGIDSIDLIDLLYSLEKKYSISIEVNELPKLAVQELGDVPFEKDNIITDEGLGILQEFVGESQRQKLRKGLTVQEIPSLFTVRSLCNLVIKRLAAKAT
jgi:acyl carrier protein